MSLRGIGVVVCATAEVGSDGAGDAEERLSRAVDRPEDVRHNDRAAVRGLKRGEPASREVRGGEDDVTPEQVAEKVGELLPPDSTLPLKDITVVVEGVFAGMRGKVP